MTDPRNNRVTAAVLTAGNSMRSGILWTAATLGVILAIITIIGCSGSDTTPAATGDRSVSALQLPDRISVTQEGAGESAAELARGELAFNDAGTDYSSQETRTWVDDNTDALEMVNEILEIMDQTNYPDYVNYGPYKALVKGVAESGQSQGGATQSNTQTESYSEMTLNVTRANESSPMYVNIWLEVPDGPGGGTMLVQGRFEVTRAQSGDYPYGELTAHFKGNQLDASGSVGTEIFRMALGIGRDDASDQVSIQFVEDFSMDGSAWVERTRANILTNSDMTTGTAYSYSLDEDSMMGPGDPTGITSYMAFNESHMKFQNADTDELTAFDKTNLTTRVYRYKVFDAENGSAVTRNSGFPFETGTGEYGYIGYWGMWTPHGITVDDGDTITRAETGDTYTVVKKRGKLIKHTRTQVTLGDLDGVDLSYYSCGEGGCVDQVINWIAGEEKFRVVGTRNWDNGGNIVAVSNGAEVTFANEWEGAWCESLRAYLPLGRLARDENGNSTAPTNASILKYHSEQTVNPGALEGDLTLYCWDFTVDFPVTGADITNDAVMTAQANYWNNPTETAFTYDVSEVMLLDADGDAVTFPAGMDLSGTYYSWGYHLMPLITTRLSAENSWQAWDQETYYSWQTGTDEWQMFSTVVNETTGEYASFDPPLMLDYTHDAANDINGGTAHQGKKFTLDYDGFELHIPWEYDSGSGVSGEWKPMLNLKDGTVLTDGTGHDYVLKGVDKARIMSVVDDAASVVLDVDMAIPAPTLTYDAAVTAAIGSLPDAEIPSGADAPLTVITGNTIF